MEKSGFGTASLVLGIISIIFSFIPYINVIALILSIFAFIFGIISLCKKASKGFAIVGIILAILTFLIAINMNNATTDALNDAVDEFNSSVEEMTTNLLENGTMEVTNEKLSTEYGYSTLNGKVVNKSNDNYSYVEIKVNFYDKSGTLLDSSFDNVTDLAAGESWKFSAGYTEDVASYKIIEVTGTKAE